MNPHSAKSYVDALILRLAEEYYPRVSRPWLSIEHRSSTDNFLGDPSIGIPTVMPRGGYGVNAHHNSYDTPATIDPKSMRDLMVMNAAYTYFIAAAGPAENRWMAELALTRGESQVAAAAQRTLDQIAAAENAERLGQLLHQGRERIDYSVERETQSVRSAFDLKAGLADLATFGGLQKARVDRAITDRAASLNLGPIRPIAPPANPEAAKIVVRRKRMGTITFEDLPREQREGYPAASFFNVQVAALYWCDGKRNLAEVIRLTQLETGQQFDFLGYFKFLEKRGYVEFVR